MFLLATLAYAQDVPLTEPDKKTLLEAKMLGCSPENPCMFGLAKNRVAYIFSNSLFGGQLSNGSLLIAETSIVSSTPLFRRSALTKLSTELNCPRVKLDDQNRPVPLREDEPHCHITYHFGVNGFSTMVQVLLHEPTTDIEVSPPDHVFWTVNEDGSVHRRMCNCHGPI